MTERTLVLVKPDGVERGLVGEVIARIERKGLRLAALELRTVERSVAEQHYAEHDGKPFYESLLEFITSGPVVAAAVEGPRAISAFRQIAGGTDPVEKAAPGSLRGDYGLEVQYNLVHGSDSPESAARELKLWFPHLAGKRRAKTACPLSVPGDSVHDVDTDDVLIDARGLRKRFGDFEAVRGVDVAVRRGEAFGFLGPNGAGKSSTMRMIGCVSPRTGGELRILGMDPHTDGPAIRARIGVVPQEDNLDVELSVRQNLQVYGRYFGLSRAAVRARAAELMEFAQLTERADAMVEPLSGGMKRRLTIARSLVNNPELLLLDEPTTGLDPQARHLLWDKLFRLKATGVTLVVTTHYMDEAEQLCDRLVVMDGGLIAAEGSPSELIERYSTREVLELRFRVGEQDGVAERVVDLAKRVEELPDRLLLYTDDGEAALATVRERAVCPVSTLVRRSTLEDVFLRLTGRSLVD